MVRSLTMWIGLVCFLAMSLCASGAMAAESPSATLQGSVDQILKILQEPGYKNPATRPPLRAQIEKRIHDIFDFSEFSARTVGQSWPSFSDTQKKAFDEAFADLLLITYLDRVQGYNGEKIIYNGEILSSKGDRSEVRTTVALADKKQVPVAYRMMIKNNRWVVYDVLIENVSLIKNYRSQFQDVLSKGNPEELIARVKARANELRTEAAGN